MTSSNWSLSRLGSGDLEQFCDSLGGGTWMRSGSGGGYLTRIVPEAGSLTQRAEWLHYFIQIEWMNMTNRVYFRYPDLKKVGVVLCGGISFQIRGGIESKQKTPWLCLYLH